MNSIEEEIRKETVEGLIELKKFTEYEIKSSWWAGFIFWGWGQDLVVDYYIRKTRRKWKRYKFVKLFEDVKEEEQRAEGERPYRRETE